MRQFEHLDGRFLTQCARQKDERHLRTHLPRQPQCLQGIHSRDRVVGHDQAVTTPPQGFLKPGVRIHAVDFGGQAVFAQERQRQVGVECVVFQVQNPQCRLHRFTFHLPRVRCEREVIRRYFPPSPAEAR